MPLVWSHMANRLLVTGQTKNVSDTFMRTITTRHVMLPSTAEGPTLEPGLGSGLVGECLVCPRGSRPGQAQINDAWPSPSGPATCRRNHEGPVQRGCKEVVDEGGDLNDPISECWV
ncbi:hypothetical protein AMECASPLE_016759 [Ameca splendens]|uniref:Uncharacterized protein n=1 Tax=Ameca splendens TaxID=208324 RepID=A0ABV0ZCB7_9TELE